MTAVRATQSNARPDLRLKTAASSACPSSRPIETPNIKLSTYNSARIGSVPEPDWMFWQAERFSMCFLIARDRLLQFLNEGREVSSWLAIRCLAEAFGVSPSMMRTRLVKMGAIVIKDGKPEIVPLLKQRGVLGIH